jgi:hypothetical protein
MQKIGVAIVEMGNSKTTERERQVHCKSLAIVHEILSVKLATVIGGVVP